MLCSRTFSFSSSSLLFHAAAGVIFLKIFFGESIVFPPMFVASTMASCFVSNAHSREQCFVVCPTSFGGKRYFLNVSYSWYCRVGGEAYRGTLLYTDFVVAGFSSTSTSIGSAQRVFVLVHVQYLALAWYWYCGTWPGMVPGTQWSRKYVLVPVVLGPGTRTWY